MTDKLNEVLEQCSEFEEYSNILDLVSPIPQSLDELRLLALFHYIGTETNTKESGSIGDSLANDHRRKYLSLLIDPNLLADLRDFIRDIKPLPETGVPVDLDIPKNMSREQYNAYNETYHARHHFLDVLYQVDNRLSGKIISSPSLTDLTTHLDNDGFILAVTAGYRPEEVWGAPLREGDLKLFTALIRAGAKVNAPIRMFDREYETALACILSHGLDHHISYVDQLMDAGAKINLREFAKETVLELKSRIHRGMTTPDPCKGLPENPKDDTDADRRKRNYQELRRDTGPRVPQVGTPLFRLFCEKYADRIEGYKPSLKQNRRK